MNGELTAASPRRSATAVHIVRGVCLLDVTISDL